MPVEVQAAFLLWHTWAVCKAITCNNVCKACCCAQSSGWVHSVWHDMLGTVNHTCCASAVLTDWDPVQRQLSQAALTLSG